MYPILSNIYIGCDENKYHANASCIWSRYMHSLYSMLVCVSFFLRAMLDVDLSMLNLANVLRGNQGTYPKAARSTPEFVFYRLVV